MKKVFFYLHGLVHFFGVYLFVSLALLILNHLSWQGNEEGFVSQGYNYWISFRTIIVILAFHMLYKLWFIISQRSKLVDRICSKEGIARKEFFSRSFKAIAGYLDNEK